MEYINKKNIKKMQCLVYITEDLHNKLMSLNPHYEFMNKSKAFSMMLEDYYWTKMRYGKTLKVLKQKGIKVNE